MKDSSYYVLMYHLDYMAKINIVNDGVKTKDYEYKFL